MANHGFVKTRKFMSPAAITQVLQELNESHFYGKLKFEYSDETGNEAAWGPHVWLIKLDDEVLRVCWLNTQRSWEIRHGGGGSFAWWVDSVITNEIALRFNGTISDEGVSEKWKGEPGKYKLFVDYLRGMYHHSEGDLQTALIQQEQKYVPPEFRADLGPEIKLEFVYGTNAS